MDFNKLLENIEEHKKYFEQDEYNQLISIIEKAKDKAEKSVDKKLAEEYKEKGNKDFKSGNFKAAVENYSLALENDPNNEIFYSNRAAAYGKLKKIEEAIKDCEEAIKINPQFLKVYYRLAGFYSEIDKDEEIKVYEEILKINPDDIKIKQKIQSLKQQDNGSIGEDFKEKDISALLNNPELIQMAQNFMKDKSPEDLKRMAEMFKK
ncbi:Tetratricopeptide repeat domain containing protein [Spraguea lophii 42_110]|uniref:Tetratricopeptide repeat domain containing protein n=1 Tax=Spraguea lophii (strain 42_110) TaxID=1358809 RepID=S7WA34_SPRLO|nr:Tetratricopeptide repeat domain containing protein [Spraguea lophii 42_110]